MAHKAKRDEKRRPTHPGEVLRECVLSALSLSVSAAADALGIYRQTLHRILAEKFSVSPAIALRLGKFCGNGASVWLNMQRIYDLWNAEREIAHELGRIKMHKAL